MIVDTASRTDDALLAQLDGLSPAKRALLEQRLREARSRASSAGIPRGAEGEASPLSFAQELLWRLEQAAPGMSTYNVPRAMHVVGELDLAQLRKALNGVVKRHAILRSVVEGGTDAPRLAERAARDVEVNVVDLSALDPVARKQESMRVLREAASEPFDLARDLLLRATVVRLADEEHALVLVSHHIASDGSSGGIMMRDLDALYRGDEPAPLAIQFSDFARWQRTQLDDARVEALKTYWRKTLAGAPARLELPTDRPRPLAPSFNGARETLLLGNSLGEIVQATARAHSTTPFVVLLAAFEVMMHRYSRQDDVVVGTVVTGRSQPEVEGVVGYFSNTLPLRVTFEGDPTFADIVARVRDASLGANEHAELPYETIALEQRAGALFDVMFAMIDESAAPAELGDAMMMPIALDRGVSKFDITIGPAFTSEGLRVGIEYRTDLFDAATIQRMLSHFGVVLAAATAAPDTRVAELPLLTPAERDLVLNEWNATEVTYPGQATLSSLLSGQAWRTPDATAVSLASDPSAMLSFAELDARATTLARALVVRGVKSGVLVGVCMERSLELVVSLVAIIKAGGAYVPLDPEYPADRLEYMIADAKCPVLLTQARVKEAVLSGVHGAEILCVDAQWDAIASSGAGELPTVQPDDLAYMIYTSGSTGKPKGALNRHRGIVNRLLWMQGEY
ncbi:MAG: condensation domain-containing protein, partial [Gemmatimonadaceae bacterium]